MQTHELYLPMLIPLWGIFIGLALVIIGFVDKKASFTYFGWGVLMEQEWSLFITICFKLIRLISPTTFN